MTDQTPTTDIATVPIDDLIRHPDNPRQGDVGAISASIEVNGWYGTVVAQSSTGRVLAGNHRIEAARHLGMREVPVYWVDVDDATARRILLADNRTNDLATYDDAVLAELLSGLAEDDDLLGTGWDGDDLDALLADSASDGDDDPGAGAVPDDPITERGDLIILGQHRLVCGDATDEADRALLLDGARPDAIYTDPPYGMNLETDYKVVHSGFNKMTGFAVAGSNTYRPVIGDDAPYDAAPIIEAFKDVNEQFWWGADYYRDTIPDGGSWVVWDKRESDTVNLDQIIGSAFELCWSRQTHRRELARVLWTGWHGLAAEDTTGRIHPTQKPTTLARFFMDRWIKDGWSVLDLYAGSGSTLMACEATGRRCYAMEIDPGYCDVIVTRWEEATGQTAMRP